MYRHETNYKHVENTDKYKSDKEDFENEDVNENENDDMRNRTFFESFPI